MNSYSRADRVVQAEPDASSTLYVLVGPVVMAVNAARPGVEEEPDCYMEEMHTDLPLDIFPQRL